MQSNGIFPTYVFASVEPQMLDAVTEHLKTLGGFNWFAPVTGRFDLVVQLKGPESSQIYEQVNRIREIRGIQSTQTCTPFEGFTDGKNMKSSEPFGLVLLGVRQKAPEVVQALKRLSQVSEAFVVPGEFDIVATLKGRNYEEIIAQVQKIADVQGVKTSETLFAYKPIWA